VRGTRERRLDDRLLEVAQFVAAWVHGNTSGHLESPHAVSRLPVYELAAKFPEMLSRLRIA
jgi:hypothetical protein